jgi:HPt (histidine-containing phosphotransfer) domain-containing protein
VPFKEKEMNLQFIQEDMVLLDPIALDTLNEYVGIEKAIEIAETFVEDADEKLKMIHLGLVEGNAKNVAYSCHSLKSSASLLGLIQLAKLSSHCEKLSLQEQLIELQTIMLQLEETIAASLNALKKSYEL